MSDHPPPWHGLSSPCVLRPVVGGALRALVLAAFAALASCAVGPDYKAPAAEAPAAWVGAPEGTPAVEGSSVTEPATPDVSRWWTVFNDPHLTSLIERAVASNLDLQLAESRLRQARATRAGAGAGLWPTVDANAGAARAHAAGVSSNLFRAGFDAAWEIDVFGGTRRNIEAAEADVLAAQEDQRDVLVILAAEVATTYFDIRGLERQLAVARENLQSQEQSAAITHQRYEGGFVSGLDAASADAQVASTRSLIPTLESGAQQNRFALAVLLGLEPGSLLAEMNEGSGSDMPPTPPQVPVGLPSDLLRRRPDIRRAELQRHAATARIGVATADLWPKFSLTGSLGVQGSQFSALGNSSNNFWSIGPSVTWRIFDAGAIRANIEIQEAITDQTLVTYRKTVLTSLQEVESALIAYAREQERRSALVDAAAAARKAVDIATTRYTEGQTNFLDVLTAQRTLFATEDALTSSDTNVVTDLVALYKALGGGWEEEPKPEGSGS